MSTKWFAQFESYARCGDTAEEAFKELIDNGDCNWDDLEEVEFFEVTNEPKTFVLSMKPMPSKVL